jgi:transposase
VFRVWRRLLKLCDKTVLEDIEHDEDVGVVIAHVRPKSRWTRRCGRCDRRSSRFDNGDGRRRWRGLDLGTVQVFLEADAPRVLCRRHGVTVAAVPWARHGARHTRAFEDTVGWLATQCSKTAVTRLLFGVLRFGETGDCPPRLERTTTGCAIAQELLGDQPRFALLNGRDDIRAAWC